PQLRRNRAEPRARVGWDTALDTAAEIFGRIIAAHGPDAVAFYISGQFLTEDYYVFNKLAKGLIGTNNLDSIRACACPRPWRATSRRWVRMRSRRATRTSTRPTASSSGAQIPRSRIPCCSG